MRLIESICQRISGQRRLDDRGVAIVEAAVVFPILVALTFSIVEVGLIMTTLTSMEGGLKEASRYGITGQSPTDSSRIEKIRAILDQHTIDLVDFREAIFTVKTYSSFSKVGQPEPFADSIDVTSSGFDCHNDQFDADPECHETYTEVNGQPGWQADIGVTGPGQAGEVVSYTVEVPWHVLTERFQYIFGRYATIPLRATIVVRNEPNLK